MAVLAPLASRICLMVSPFGPIKKPTHLCSTFMVINGVPIGTPPWLTGPGGSGAGGCGGNCNASPGGGAPSSHIDLRRRGLSSASCSLGCAASAGRLGASSSGGRGWLSEAGGRASPGGAEENPEAAFGGLLSRRSSSGRLSLSARPRSRAPLSASLRGRLRLRLPRALLRLLPPPAVAPPPPRLRLRLRRPAPLLRLRFCRRLLLRALPPPPPPLGLRRGGLPLRGLRPLGLRFGLLPFFGLLRRGLRLGLLLALCFDRRFGLFSFSTFELFSLSFSFSTSLFLDSFRSSSLGL
mmetsp:Transcript_28065/g.64803  ORF Transcript_28065/g.64803 Transcript_28065/m.64803 type:complete len:295 (+) Transcript_28065:2194-3078(+)